MLRAKNIYSHKMEFSVILGAFENKILCNIEEQTGCIIMIVSKW